MQIIEADLTNPEHAAAIVTMTAAYAMDEMGNGGPLPADVLARLVPALREHPTTIVFLAFDGGRAAGIATCFLGFSTFAARPLIKAIRRTAWHSSRCDNCSITPPKTATASPRSTSTTSSRSRPSWPRRRRSTRR